MSDNEKQAVPPTDNGNARYLLLVGGLLLIIVITLAVLWQLERHNRMATQVQLNDAKLQAMMQGKIVEAYKSEKFPREDLPSRDVTIDGKTREIFLISAAAGEKIGFKPGDIVEIGAAPAAPQPDEQPGE